MGISCVVCNMHFQVGVDMNEYCVVFDFSRLSTQCIFHISHGIFQSYQYTDNMDCSLNFLLFALLFSSLLSKICEYLFILILWICSYNGFSCQLQFIFSIDMIIKNVQNRFAITVIPFIKIILNFCL